MLWEKNEAKHHEKIDRKNTAYITNQEENNIYKHGN